ncbi:hypothetical protein DPMN_125226 [Dreissena polymorpha]|uniref:Uncharacterized protein n=1 Tax=Dreissena polymorpha TaxID=45954 RepID=A0A9D4H110_DREPO|nr:hypothetical protein DPMN_125226 [Dreissena polymorpha]
MGSPQQCGNRILKAFANSLDPDETPQNVASHLDPNLTRPFEVTNKRAKQKCTEQGLNETGVNIGKVLGSPMLFYLNDAEVTQSNFHPLLILTDKYEVFLLFQHMTEFIKSVVDVDTALSCWSVHYFKCKHCMKTLLELIDINAVVLLNFEIFLRLNQRTVLTIIQG